MDKSKLTEEIEKLTKDQIDAFDFTKEEIHHIVQLTNSVTQMMESSYVANKTMLSMYDRGLLNLHKDIAKYLHNWNKSYEGIRAYSNKLSHLENVKVH